MFLNKLLTNSPHSSTAAMPHHNNNNDTPEIDRQLPEFNLMQTVKRRLYAMRNGALAAQMRNAGLLYRINFGLNIPQIKEIAMEIIDSGLSSKELLDLAAMLWENENTRESRLIAPMLYPADIMDRNTAQKWLTEAQTTEVADHLCHSLLRHLPFAARLATAVPESPRASDMNRYCAMRLLLNLLMLGRISPDEARSAAEAEMQRNVPLTASVARQIISEAEWR